MAKLKGWSAPLSEEVITRSGKRLRTLAAARAYALANQGYQNRDYWQAAARYMMEAAESGDTGEATRQIKLALLHDGMLAVPPRR